MFPLFSYCVPVYMHVWMQTLSGELICGSLISLIHQRHMDGGVEKENGVMMAGERAKREG